MKADTEDYHKGGPTTIDLGITRQVPVQALEPTARAAAAVYAVAGRPAATTTDNRKDEPMETHCPSREEAMALLKEYNSSESLINHALAVEAVMRFLARKLDQDQDEWGVIGLIHDLDYEKFPEQHCTKTKEILEQHGWPGEYIRSAVSHGWGICSDVEPQSPLEKYLYAIDELTGLVTACALVRPSRSVMDMKPKSVRKKWKQKNFAAGVDRATIEKGAEMLGVEPAELISDVIGGMREVAAEIGL
jgi:putative nucleotidyltransferase with HDIG domain